MNPLPLPVEIQKKNKLHQIHIHAHSFQKHIELIHFEIVREIQTEMNANKK